jgi:probable blue pigment (indigoidine) exporter
VRVVLAGLVGVLGVALLVSTPNTHLDVVGILAALGSTTVFAIGAVLTQRWGRPASFVAFTGWQLTAGGLFLLPIWLLTEGVPDRLGGTAVGGFAYLALANTAVAYALFFFGIEHLSATTVSFLTLLIPIVAAVIGYAVLDQSLSGLQIFGMLLAGVGLVGGQIVTAPRRREARPVLLRR